MATSKGSCALGVRSALRHFSGTWTGYGRLWGISARARQAAPSIQRTHKSFQPVQVKSCDFISQRIAILVLKQLVKIEP